MTCEEKSDKLEIDTSIDPSRLQALMYSFHSDRKAGASLTDALEKRIKTTQDFMRYLSFVPIGRSINDEERIDPKLRIRIFHKRGCICELCQAKLTRKSFQLHHTNYFEGNDPNFLKVVCVPCHSIVNMLTGVVAWFESKTQPSEADREHACMVTRTVIVRDVDEEETEVRGSAYLNLFQRRRS